MCECECVCVYMYVVGMGGKNAQIKISRNIWSKHF